MDFMSERSDMACASKQIDCLRRLRFVVFLLRLLLPPTLLRRLFCLPLSCSPRTFSSACGKVQRRRRRVTWNRRHHSTCGNGLKRLSWKRHCGGHGYRFRSQDPSALRARVVLLCSPQRVGGRTSCHRRGPFRTSLLVGRRGCRAKMLLWVGARFVVGVYVRLRHYSSRGFAS